MVAGASSFHIRCHSWEGDCRSVGSNETCWRMPLKSSSSLAQMTHVFVDKEAMEGRWGISSSEQPEPSP